MKKIISLILLLGMVLSLSACGKVEITMQEIYDASNLNALLGNHESVYVKYTMNGETYEEMYRSKEYSYSRYVGEVYGLASDFISFTTDDAFYFYDNSSYGRSFLISKDGLTDTRPTEDDSMFVLEPDTVKETIQSVKKKDGCITVDSFMGPEVIEASKDEGLVSASNEYVLDAKNRELISVKSVFEYNDGTVYHITIDFIYDGEITEEMKAFVEYEQQTENLRTITIVSNPGTEKEKSESVQLPKGVSVVLEPDFILEIDLFLNPDIEGAFELYSDAACTEPFTDTEDYSSDAIIYVKWNE